MYLSAFMCKVFWAYMKSPQAYSNYNRSFDNCEEQFNTRWLPTTQASLHPQAPLIFLSTYYNASPVTQVNPPGSLDAILLSAIAAFNQYFLAERFCHKCRSTSNSMIWSLSLSYCKVTFLLVYMMSINKVQKESNEFLLLHRNRKGKYSKFP